MTSAAFRAALSLIHWSNRTLAAQLNRDEHQVRRWGNGSARVPDDVAAWLREAAVWHEQHPAPRL